MMYIYTYMIHIRALSLFVLNFKGRRFLNRIYRYTAVSMAASAAAAAAAGDGPASTLPDFLKPFHDRASLAEVRERKRERIIMTET